MQFRTQIPIPKSNFAIDYTSKIVSLGSCFAVNIADKFDYFKFQNTVNPFGILFHPLAIEKFVDFAVSQKKITGSDIFFHQERWHSFDAHSDLSTPDKTELIQNLNRVIEQSHEHLKKATHIIITLGTSWVYRNSETNWIVANCHKVPQKQFKKELLSVEAIQQSINNSLACIAKINKKAQIIFTISPVRHIKDGFVENQISKSHLISALHHVLQSPSSTRNYFPSYEIMMDELRDYRFYTEDMLHPNAVAIEYIWERFSQTWISETAVATMAEVEIVQKGLAHRSFNPDSEMHRVFLQKLQTKITQLQQQFPHISF